MTLGHPAVDERLDQTRNMVSTEVSTLLDREHVADQDPRPLVEPALPCLPINGDIDEDCEETGSSVVAGKTNGIRGALLWAAVGCVVLSFLLMKRCGVHGNEDVRLLGNGGRVENLEAQICDNWNRLIKLVP